MKTNKKQAHPPHMKPETRRKLVESIRDALAPWDLEIFKASGRLPRAQQRDIQAHQTRMLFKKHMRAHTVVTHPQYFSGKTYSYHPKVDVPNS